MITSKSIRPGASPLAETLRVGPNAARAMASVVLTALLSYAMPGFAQSQSAALEYYVQPDYTGVNTITVSATGLSLENELSGTSLTFNTSGFFEHEFVSQNPIDFSASIDVNVPGFAASVPAEETILPVSRGTFRLTTPEGELIEGTIGDESAVKLVPYPRAPRVFFYELTLVPTTTTVTPPQSAALSLDAIRTWGIIVTDGRSFQGGFGWGQNHQYAASVEF